MKTVMTLQQWFNSNNKDLDLLDTLGELASYVVNTIESNEMQGQGMVRANKRMKFMHEMKS